MTEIASTDVSYRYVNITKALLELKAPKALLFAYIDNLLRSPPDDLQLNVASSLSVIENTRQSMIQAGVQDYVFQDAYDLLSSLIESISTPKNGVRLNPEELLAIFQNKAPIRGFEDGTHYIPPLIYTLDLSVGVPFTFLDGVGPAYLVYYLRLVTVGPFRHTSSCCLLIIYNRAHI